MTSAHGRAPETKASDSFGDAHDVVEALAEARRALRATQQRVSELEAELRDISTRVDRLRSASRGANEPRFAALYVDFADRFRGTFAEVSAKLSGYLPDVRRLVRSGGVVDIGSGRGEWLTLLRDAGIPASGVETNPAYVAAGRQRRLDMALGEGVAHLQNLEPDSVDLVTAFHLIEHLDVDDVLGLLNEAWRALRPGGGIFLETPNPNNLMMAACDFYNDPTHRSPLPPALTEYLVTRSGFERVEVRPLHPKQAPVIDVATDSPTEKLLAAILYGPQDYAVLGYKPPLASTRGPGTLE